MKKIIEKTRILIGSLILPKKACLNIFGHENFKDGKITLENFNLNERHKITILVS